MLAQIELDTGRLSFGAGGMAHQHVVLARLLFVWSLEHPQISYRQGMHEIAAVILKVCHIDASSRTTEKSHEQWIEHDAFSIFSAVMERWGSLYRTPTSRSDGTSITEHVERIRTFLASVDPALSVHLNLFGVELQVFALRWLRLLFARELPFMSLLTLWDFLFARSESDLFIDWICVVALLRMRATLLAADQNEALALLMRPWKPPETTDQDEQVDYINVPALVRQAEFLMQNPTPSTAVQRVLNNQDHLGIELHVCAPSKLVKKPAGRSTGNTTQSLSVATIDTLSRAAFSGAQRTAAWAYANAAHSLAGLGAESSQQGERDGFPASWRLKDGSRRQRFQVQDSMDAGKSNRAKVLNRESRLVERDRQLGTALKTLLDSFEGRAVETSQQASIIEVLWRTCKILLADIDDFRCSDVDAVTKLCGAYNFKVIKAHSPPAERLDHGAVDAKLQSSQNDSALLTSMQKAFARFSESSTMKQA